MQINVNEKCKYNNAKKNDYFVNIYLQNKMSQYSLLDILEMEAEITRQELNLLNKHKEKIENKLKTIKRTINTVDITTFNTMNTMDLSHISVKYRNESSYNNYNVSDLKSALQKYIRRAETDKALFCAWELYLFKLVEGGKRIYTNFLHRLMIITLEDICDVNTFLKVHNLFELLLKDNNKKKDENTKTLERNIEIENNIYAIVKILCESVKSRENSFYRTVYFNATEDILKEHPVIYNNIRDYKDNEHNYKMLLKDETDEVNMLSYHYQKLFKELNPLCIYYGHRISQIQTNKKYNMSKKGKWLVMHLSEDSLKKMKLIDIEETHKVFIK